MKGIDGRAGVVLYINKLKLKNKTNWKLMPFTVSKWKILLTNGKQIVLIFLLAFDVFVLPQIINICFNIYDDEYEFIWAIVCFNDDPTSNTMFFFSIFEMFIYFVKFLTHTKKNQFYYHIYVGSLEINVILIKWQEIENSKRRNSNWEEWFPIERRNLLKFEYIVDAFKNGDSNLILILKTWIWIKTILQFGDYLLLKTKLNCIYHFDKSDKSRFTNPDIRFNLKTQTVNFA